MGYKSSANHALSMPAMVHCIELIKKDAARSCVPSEASMLWKLGAYLTICMAASLRGHEGFFLDLAGLRKHIASGKDGVVPPGYSIHGIPLNFARNQLERHRLQSGILVGYTW